MFKIKNLWIVILCCSASNIWTCFDEDALKNYNSGFASGRRIGYQEGVQAGFREGSRLAATGVIRCNVCGTDKGQQLQILDCSHVICKSCLASKRHTALNAGQQRPRCQCGREISYELDDPNQNRTVQRARPSAPTMNQNNNLRRALCASGCNSEGNVSLSCGHHICASCLASRIGTAEQKARKDGTQFYVTCPARDCNHVLTNNETRGFRS